MSKIKIFRNNAAIDPPRTPGPHGTPPGPVRAWQRPRVSFAPPASACLHELIWPRGERSSFIMQKKITQTMLRTTSHARRGTVAPPRDQPQRGCVPRRHLRSRHSCAHTAQRLRAMSLLTFVCDDIDMAEYGGGKRKRCIFDVDEAVEANDKPRRRRFTRTVRSVANV